MSIFAVVKSINNNIMYFTNINSFSELKSQYRTLAMANHPDRGGSEETMKAINAEFDRLYLIWMNREPEATRPTASAEQSRREFYTAWGWEGSRYDGTLSTKDIAALVREYCKSHWNQWRFSVRCKYFSGGSEIRIELNGGPIACGTAREEGICDAKYGIQTAYRHCEHDDRINPLAEAVMRDVVEYCQSFNYDDSDGQIDYFDTNFYLFERVAGSDEWRHVTGRAARLSNPSPEEPAHQAAAAVAEGVHVTVYSDRALAVTGDTKPLRARLKELGGRFCAGLTIDGVRRAGWVFSRNRYTEESLVKALGI